MKELTSNEALVIQIYALKQRLRRRFSMFVVRDPLLCVCLPSHIRGCCGAAPRKLTIIGRLTGVTHDGYVEYHLLLFHCPYSPRVALLSESLNTAALYSPS